MFVCISAGASLEEIAEGQADAEWAAAINKLLALQEQREWQGYKLLLAAHTGAGYAGCLGRMLCHC
jgi:hypothetical protein